MERTRVEAVEHLRKNDDHEDHALIYDAIERWAKGEFGNHRLCERLEQILDDLAYSLPPVEPNAEDYGGAA